jgi:hypothetical protein
LVLLGIEPQFHYLAACNSITRPAEISYEIQRKNIVNERGEMEEERGKYKRADKYEIRLS